MLSHALACDSSGKLGEPNTLHFQGGHHFRAATISFTNVIERLAETVQVFCLLYDKSHLEFKDKQVKNNHWDIINTEFANYQY